MLVRSSLLLNKIGDTESILSSFWNNLTRTMTIMSGGTRFPPTEIVSVANTPLRHKTYEFDLRLYRHSSWINVVSLHENNFATRPEEILNTTVAMASALEYVIGRTECFDIESWKVFYGTTDKINQDISIDSMAYVLDATKEYATDLFENRVEPKLDKIEEICL